MTAILNANLTAYLRLDEVSGNRADSENSNTATQVGTVGQTAFATLGTGASFAANSSNYLDCSNVFGGGANPLWIIAKVRPTTQHDGVIIGKFLNANATEGEYFLRVNNTNRTLSFTIVQGSTEITAISASNAYTAGSDHVVQAVYDPVAKSISVKVDNASAVTQTYTGADMNTTIVSTRIGQRENATRQPFNGVIGQIAVFRRVPTAAEQTEVRTRFLAKANLFARKLTSVSAGSWASASTWDKGVTPVADDRVIVQHAVTLPSSQVVGCGFDADDLPAISVVSGGNLSTSANGVALEVRGPINCFGSDSQRSIDFTNNASGIEINASVSVNSPSTTKYPITLPAQYPGTQPILRMTGISGARNFIRSTVGGGNCFIQGSGGNYFGLVDLQFCNLTRVGDATNPAITTSPNSDGSDAFASVFNLQRVNFDNCGKVYTSSNIGGYAKVRVQNCTFKNVLASDYALHIQAYSDKAGLGTRLIDRCYFATQIFLQAPRGVDVTNNVLFGGFISTGTDSTGWGLWERNLVRGVDAVGGAYSINGNVKDDYWLRDNVSATNPHFMQAGSFASVGTYTIDGVIFHGTMSDGNGDCLLIATPGSAVTINLRRCLTLPNGGGDCSGTLLSALGNANTTLSIQKCTHFSGSQGLAVGETYAGHANMISSCRSNIFWDSVGGRGYKVFDSGTNDPITDLVTAANLNFNCGHNLLPGSNGKGINNLEFSSGAPGANDVDVDPQFVAPTRNILTWDSSLGGAGTTTNALNELSKFNDDSGYNSNYSIANLLTFVKAGFQPQNMALSSAGFDGGVIGAEPVFIPPVSTGRRNNILGIALTINIKNN